MMRIHSYTTLSTPAPAQPWWCCAMSHAAYNAQWREAQEELRALMSTDQRLALRQRETDKRGSLPWVCSLYADYIRITRTLDECYDQIVQPQKRILVRYRASERETKTVVTLKVTT